MALLTLNVADAAPTARAPSTQTDTIVRGPTFRYSLKRTQNPALCEHMLRVFNENFAHPWSAPTLMSLTNDTNSSTTSKYMFPLLPGVKRSVETTEELAFSAWPTSPEFSAIHWKEATATPGGCPAGKTCPEEGPMPILVAHFDFDNDGSVDTIIKEGATFFQDYGRMRMVQEYLIVWRDQTLKITGTESMWRLEHPQDKTLTPITMMGAYLRPFVYRGVTYVASYQPDFGTASPPPPYPVREDMLIGRVHFAGRRVGTIGSLLWSADTICELKMQRLNIK
jgi:hypothetical protein